MRVNPSWYHSFEFGRGGDPIMEPIVVSLSDPPELALFLECRNVAPIPVTVRMLDSRKATVWALTLDFAGPFRDFGRAFDCVVDVADVQWTKPGNFDLLVSFAGAKQVEPLTIGIAALKGPAANSRG